MAEDQDLEELNVWLGAWRVAPPSAALRARILAAAPRGRRLAARFTWLSGIALAGAAAAGAACGVALTWGALVDARTERALSSVSGEVAWSKAPGPGGEG